MTHTKFEDITFDVLGLGFGPANLSVAAALAETWTPTHIGSNSTLSFKNALFIEKHSKFQWHPGMLLPGARMQISFMKDLATLRNPQSPFTFLSYLHSQNRLLSFINRGSTIPSRGEFADYLSWVSQRVQEEGVKVLFGHEVIGLSEGPEGTIQVLVKNLSTGLLRTLRTRDVILSPGGSAKIPALFDAFQHHQHFLHSSSYAFSIGPVLEGLLQQQRPVRVAVVGSGQSAAEVTINLRERLGDCQIAGARHEIDMILRKGSLKPSDDSPFANEIFNPEATDLWFSLTSDRTRKEMLAEYRSTNYGVVNPRTLEQLYEVIYDQRLNEDIASRSGCHPTASAAIINIRPYALIVGVEEQSPGIRIMSQHAITREVFEKSYDVVVCATGYQRSSWINLLKYSDLGKRFGLTTTSSSIRLLPSSRLASNRGDNMALSGSSTSSPSTTSSVSTPPTSPSQSFSRLDSVPNDLYVSRNYELLPVSDEAIAPKNSRVYIQGVEEMTHGLSDTLLSVAGVRAGELVRDILLRS